MSSQRCEVRVQMQVIEAQSGCPALTMVSASTLKAQIKTNNLGAVALLAAAQDPAFRSSGWVLVGATRIPLFLREDANPHLLPAAKEVGHCYGASISLPILHCLGLNQSRWSR